MSKEDIEPLDADQELALELFRRRGLLRLTDDVLSDNPGFSKYGPVKELISKYAKEEASLALAIADDCLFGCFSQFDAIARDNIFSENQVDPQLQSEAIRVMETAFISRDERRLNAIEDTIDRIIIGDPVKVSLSPKPLISTSEAEDILDEIVDKVKNQVASEFSELLDLSEPVTGKDVSPDIDVEAFKKKINSLIKAYECPECEDFSATITETSKVKNLTATRDALKSAVTKEKEEFKSTGKDPFKDSIGLFPGETKPGIFAAHGAGRTNK